MPSVSDLSAAGASAGNAAQYWPLIVGALQDEGIDTPEVEAAAAATIQREVGASWKPVREGSPSGQDALTYFENLYGYQTHKGQQLGNVQYGDGYTFRGGGWIQLTGRTNYRNYGQRIGVDLENYPSYSTDPQTAARVLAAFFKDTGVADAANARDWQRVQTLVNGGYNGYTSRFLPFVTNLVQNASDLAQQAVQQVEQVAQQVVEEIPGGSNTPLLIVIGLTIAYFLFRGK